MHIYTHACVLTYIHSYIHSYIHTYIHTYIHIHLKCYVATVQLNLNFTHVCRYTRVLAHLTLAKLHKLACAHTVAHGFGMRTQDGKHMRYTRDAHHELILGLPHYMCGVTTGTVAVGNEIQLLCS